LQSTDLERLRPRTPDFHDRKRVIWLIAGLDNG
jgi:hypothetical protein